MCDVHHGTGSHIRCGHGVLIVAYAAFARLQGFSMGDGGEDIQDIPDLNIREGQLTVVGVCDSVVDHFALGVELTVQG